MTVRLLACAAALAVGVACGRKADPLPPELVLPMPPENLGAMTTPEGVRLTWRRPLRYSGGQRMNDLAGFTIERAAADEGTPPAFAEVGRVELDDQTRFRKERRIEWLDRGTTPGRRYLYVVTARTLDGYRSRPAGPVEVQVGSPSARKDTP